MLFVGGSHWHQLIMWLAARLRYPREVSMHDRMRCCGLVSTMYSVLRRLPTESCSPKRFRRSSVEGRFSLFRPRGGWCLTLGVWQSHSQASTHCERPYGQDSQTRPVEHQREKKRTSHKITNYYLNAESTYVRQLGGGFRPGS
ncbi:hypothetical protein BJY04DRAFT_192270 [Aspergillus karnatakaensis]|uniref:uncharacterized protein n=1 Tax=Aspergillus karnatakaensis TaxID=1810916 RepID=UPI003CCE1722